MKPIIYTVEDHGDGTCDLVTENGRLTGVMNDDLPSFARIDPSARFIVKGQLSMPPPWWKKIFGRGLK